MNSIHSLIHRKVVVLSSTATVQEVARTLFENDIGCVLVSDPEGKAPGIITDRDLARLWGRASVQAPAAQVLLTAAEVMTPDLVFAEETCGLNDIIRLMEEYGVRRIPVVETVGGRTAGQPIRFSGLVTLDDLVVARLVDPAQLSRIVQRQIGRRLGYYHGAKAASHEVRDQKLGQRSSVRKQQTLERFYQQLSQATGVATNQLAELSHTILGSLVMRISYTAAMHFVAQLPETVREKLEDLPPGPDRTITVAGITEQVATRLAIPRDQASKVLQQFFSFLETWTSRGQMDHLKSQLPVEYWPLFAGASARGAQPAA